MSLSPAQIASATIKIARAAREYLDGLNEAEANSVTETIVREKASRAALAGTDLAASDLTDVVKAAVAEEVKSFMERRFGGKGDEEAAKKAATAAAKGKEKARPTKKAPRKASTASFVVSDDAPLDDDESYEVEEEEDDDDDSNVSDDDDEEEPPPRKRTKKAATEKAATSVGESPAAAAAGAASARLAPSKSHGAVLQLPLGDRRFASVSQFKGSRRFVDVREWYQPKEGDGEGLKPGQKGLSVSSAGFARLREHADELTEALEARRDASFVLEEKGGGGDGDDEGKSPGGQSGRTRKVAASNCWQNNWRVDLREYFLSKGKDGKSDADWRPTKKGVALSGAAWGCLREAMPEIEQALKGK